MINQWPSMNKFLKLMPRLKKVINLTMMRLLILLQTTLRVRLTISNHRRRISIRLLIHISRMDLGLRRLMNISLTWVKYS